MATTSATIILTGITYLMLTPNATTPTDLLVALARQDAATTNKHGYPTPRHVPYISASPGDIDLSTTRDPDYVVTHNKVTKNIYLVKDEALKLQNVYTTKLVIPATSASADRLPFFEHVPNVRTICPTCSLLQASDIVTPDFKRLALGATLDITGGQVMASAEAVDCDWDFDAEGINPKPPTIQLTQQVTVDFDVESGKGLTIVSSNPKKTPIVFKAQPITLTIGSSPIEDILLVEPADHAGVDEHFDLYYRLLEGKLAKQHPLPIRGGCASDQHNRNLGGANCPPLVQW